MKAVRTHSSGRVTATGSADVGADLVEYSGLSTAAGTGAVDTTTAAYGTTTGTATVSSGSTAAAASTPELAVGFYTDSGFDVTLTPGAGWTSRVDVAPNGHIETLVEDQTVNAGGTPAATFGTGAAPWLATAVLFKPGTGTGLDTSYAYHDIYGQLVKSVDADGAATSYAYDNLGRATTVTPPTGHSTTTSYGVFGPVTTTDPTGAYTTTTYTTGQDGYGQPATVTSYTPSGTAVVSRSYGYDAAGLTTATTDTEGNTTTTRYNENGQPTATTIPTGTTASPTTSTSQVYYDLDGRVVRSRPGLGVAGATDAYDRTVTYNTWGQVETSTEPSTAGQTTLSDRQTTYTYDVSGQLASVSKPGGVTVSYGYDSYGQLVSQSGAGAEVATPSLAFSYDPVGRLVSAKVGTNAAQTFTYDDRNLLVSSAGPAGASSFTYTAAGRVATRTDAAGTASYTYTGGQLASVVDPVSGATIAYGYDAADRPTTVTYGTGGPVETLGYDAAGRVTSDTVAQAGTTVYGYQDTFTGDLVTSQTVVGTGAGVGTNTYTYDRSQRLLSWTKPGGGGETYTYDANGNRTSVNGTTATYDARDRLLTAGTTTYTYTARGTLATTTTSLGTRSTQHNAYDQLASDGGSVNTYDGLGRLLTAGTATFTYAGTETSPVTDGSSTYGRAAGLLSVKTGASTTFAFTNSRGDVLAQVSPTGTVAATTAYTPYGTVDSTTGTSTTKLGYQGGWTSGTGLVNMNARWYDPTTGAFTSHDLGQRRQPVRVRRRQPGQQQRPVRAASRLGGRRRAGWRTSRLGHAGRHPPERDQLRGGRGAGHRRGDPGARGGRGGNRRQR